MSAAHATPPLPEPKSPMWLPALGAALFVTAGILWLATPSTPTANVDDSAAPAASASTVPSAAPPPPNPSVVGPHARMPGGPPGGQPANMQQLLDRLKAQQQQPGK